MAEERAPRTAETREKTSRKSDAWIPQSQLPVPDDRPGWKHRWIRTKMLGVNDATNVSKKLREGWEVCKAEEYKELMVMSDIDSRFEGCIEIGGCLLCRMPEEMVEQRKKFYADKTQRQIESVDQRYMQQSDPRMPVLKPDKRTRTQFGKG
jgi:hypothetical protein